MARGRLDLPRAGPALSDRGVDAVLFDLDGVIRHWRGAGAARGERAAGLPPGVVSRIAFKLPEYDGTQVGAVTHREWAEAIGRRLVADFGPGADAAIEYWVDYRGDLDAGMVALVAAVRRQCPVVLVSNATDRLRDDLAHLGLGDAFDHVVCSAELGIVKPDPRIYHHAAGLAQAAPERCFFTDDLRVNVDGARAAGLRAVLFTGVEPLRAELRAAGLDA